MDNRIMKQFLEKYDTVIFDMDGVITSEQNYWNSASLVVREYLSSEKYFGHEKIDTRLMHDDVKKIRSEVFLDDALINVLKSKGVNSNWDLGYVTVCSALALKTTDPRKIYDHACALGDNILDEYDRIAAMAADASGLDESYVKRSGRLWSEMRDCFQEWFLGDAIFEAQYGRKPLEGGKKGLLNDESPIIPMNMLVKLLEELSASKRLCTGTGRPYMEMKTPLELWGVIDYFDKNGLCNYDHVVEAEKRTGMTLTKPHPYMFLKALYGIDHDDVRLLEGDYDRSRIGRALIVGDAGADILAAMAMGADFCAVLTGISGKKARGFFEEQGAEYILDSVADMI